MTVKSIFLKAGPCAIALAALSLWFAACASGGSRDDERGLEVEKLQGSNTDIEVFPQVGHEGGNIISVAYKSNRKHIIITHDVDNTISVAYSPNGKHIVSGGNRDAMVKIWDAQSGRELQTLIGHAEGVNSVTFSPDGNFILSGSSDESIKMWDIQSGQEKRSLSGFIGKVEFVSYSLDGKFIVSINKNGTDSTNKDYKIKIWDAKSSKLLRTISGYNDTISSITFSPDGKYIAAGGIDNGGGENWYIKYERIKIWDAQSGKELRRFWYAGGPIAFSPDWKFIVSRASDNYITIRDAVSGNFLQRLSGFFNTLTAITYSPDGNFIAGAINNKIHIWDVVSGKELRSLSGNTGTVQSIAYSPDGKFIVSGAYGSIIKIWDAENGQELQTLSGYTDIVTSIAYSPDGKLLVLGSGNKIRILDVESGKPLRTFSDSVTSITFSPDGKFIVSGSINRTIKIWDTESGKLLRTFNSYTTSGNPASVKSVAYSPDGKRIICVNDDTFNEVWIFDVELGQQIMQSTIRRLDSVEKATYSSDGKCIVVHHRKGVNIYDAVTYQLIELYDPKIYKGFVRLSPNGEQIALFDFDNDGKTEILDVGKSVEDRNSKVLYFNQMKIKHILSGHIGRIKFLEYSTDGNFIITIGDGKYISSRNYLEGDKKILNDDTLRIWDAYTGQALHILSEHTKGIRLLAISPDGKQIATGSYDGSVRFWDIATGKEIAQFVSFSGNDTQLASASRGLTVETQTASSTIDGEWLSITPDGYYQASPRGDRYLNVRINNTVSGIDAYRAVFYNPDVVQARLQGRPDPASKANVTIQQAAAFIPPTVTIQSPANFSTTNTATANLSVTITSQNQPVKNIKIIVNGRLIGKDELAAVKGTGLQPERASLTVTGNQKTVNLSLPLELEPGNNCVEVVAFNGYSESRRFIDVTRNAPAGEKPPLPNLWILAVGVNGYDNAGTKLQGLTSLNFAVADAKGLVDSLKAQESKRYAKVNTMLIADGEAQAPTTANIRQGFKFLEGADPRRDIVILFLAGHGISAQESKFFFLPKDAVFTGNRIVDANKAISGDEIMSVLDAPGNRLVFIDACQSGGVDNDRMVRSLMDTNAFVFTASRGNELSYESRELGHGFFTYSVMSALKGAPAALAQGNVSVLSMSGFVKDDVPKKTGGRQNPSAYSLGFYDFPVAVIK